MRRTYSCKHRVEPACERGHKHACRKRAGGNQRNGAVPAKAAVLADAQQQESGYDHNRDGNRKRRSVHRHRNGKRAEADVGKPVADH